MFGKSLIISLVLKFILPKGIDWLEHLSEQKTAEIKAFIYKIIPGSMFDELVWSVVASLLPKLFEVARSLLLQHSSSAHISEFQMAQAVFEVGSSKPFLAKD